MSDECRVELCTVYRTGPSAGLCPRGLSPLYLCSPFHLPRACAGEILEMLKKENSQHPDSGREWIQCCG